MNILSVINAKQAFFLGYQTFLTLSPFYDTARKHLLSICDLILSTALYAVVLQRWNWRDDNLGTAKREPYVPPVVEIA